MTAQTLMKPCPDCNGAAFLDTDHDGLKPCPTCGSTGEVPLTTQAPKAKRAWTWQEWQPPQDDKR